MTTAASLMRSHDRGVVQCQSTSVLFRCREAGKTSARVKRSCTSEEKGGEIMANQRVLLRGGHILSMDPEIGDVFGGDVLIEDNQIAAVGVSLDVQGADVIDATDCIVIPGFIDSHRHTWETVIRGIAPDVALAGYFDLVLDQLAPAYRPEDVYAGNYLGALEAI